MILNYRGSVILLLVVSCIIMLLSCSANPAEELFETAQFEELQNNRDHAQQLYEEIVKKYPDSEQALKAKDRLSDLRN